MEFNSFSDAKEQFSSYVVQENWKTDYELVQIDGQFFCDMVIRYEHIEDDLHDVATRCGLDHGLLNLPHTKRTSDNRLGHSVSDFYTDRTTAHVVNRCRWIFDRFGYEETPVD